MESVIPRLVESLQKRNENPIIGTLELLFSFVAAFEHIPSLRRLDLFKSLANKLGPIDFLFALVVLLLDKYPDDEPVAQFAIGLVGSYDASTQLKVGGIRPRHGFLCAADDSADGREVHSPKPRHP